MRRGRKLKRLKRKDYVWKLRLKELDLSEKLRNKLKKRKRRDLGLKKKKELEKNRKLKPKVKE